MDVPRKGRGAAIKNGGQSLPCKGGDADGTQAEGESPSIPASIGNHGTYHVAIDPESLLTARLEPERSMMFTIFD